MFNTFTMKNNSEDMTPEEDASIRKYVNRYAQRDGYEWINTVLPDAKFKWCNAMTSENSIMGAYDLLSDTIFLMPDSNKEQMKNTPFWSPDLWGELIAPTGVHELRHRWQRQKSVILYTLLCLPIIRQLTIEADAWAHTPKQEATEPFPGFEERFKDESEEQSTPYEN